MNHSTKSRERAGFTLIELLVVIAIIGILAAILFPVFATARDKARQSTCASNMKQLGLGFVQYAQDFDETLPSLSLSPTGGHTSDAYGGWAGRLDPYVSALGVFTCPSDTSVPQDYRYIVVSYAYNANLTASDYPSTVQVPYTLSQLTAPDKTVALYEVQGSSVYQLHGGQGFNGGSDSYSPIGEGCPQSWTKTNASAGGSYRTSCNTWHTPRHAGGANYLALDGHVKWLPGYQVSLGTVPSNTNYVPYSASDWHSCGITVLKDWTGNQFQLTFSPV